ncbi:DUF1488 family protein [Paraburkholderia phytofirmans]|uniref:DUF1488 family protein n=1 Tax=Paraburkholderia TaxID=1822464 RepID=UPI0009ED441B
MDITLSRDTRLSDDGKLIRFIAVWRGRSVQCAISIEALEEHFWAPDRADSERLSRTYWDGRIRIAAAVERRLLRNGSEPIVILTKHFSR